MATKIKRVWLILQLEDTREVIILKRSKHSRNPKQWDFIGGSSRKRKNPRNLIRKESLEEIGLVLSGISLIKTTYNKKSIYYYFTSIISRDELSRLELNYEHSAMKLIHFSKLKTKKKLHHSIKVFIKTQKHLT